MNDIKDALNLYYNSNLSLRKASITNGVPRSTLYDYIRRIDEAGISADELLLYPLDELKKKLFPEKEQEVKIDRRLPDIGYIAQEIRKQGVTYFLLWEEYKKEHPLGYSYTQFKFYMHKGMKKLNPSFRNIYKAGETMFADFSGLKIIYTENGIIKKAEIFVSVLGASDCLFVKALSSQNMEEFNLSHKSAFEYYGGVPQMIIPDNLKSAVIKNNRKELILNKSYKDLARHYNFIMNPARPYKPKDKPKVENGVKIIQRWIIAKLRNYQFFSIDEINKAIIPLLNEYNNRKMRLVDKSRFELLIELDLPNMKELPVNEYVYRTYEKRSVPKDYHIAVDKSFYSVPYNLIGDNVDIWHSKTSVEIYYSGKAVAVHPKVLNNTSTLKEHMPLNHQAMTDRFNPRAYLVWGLSIGFNTAKFIKKILEKKLHYSIINRKISQIKFICKKYTNEEIEEAAKKILSMNTMEVKHFAAILENKEAKKEIILMHENIRGENYYKL